MRKFFTVIFFLLFTLLFTFVLLLGELKFYVLTPAFIKDPMRETQVYSKLVKNADALTSIMQGQDPAIEQGIAQMPEAAQKLSQAMLKSVDEKWMEREAEKGIDALYAYATTDQPDVKISLDLKDFKTRLRKNLYTYMLEEYNKLPEVPLEQFDQQMAQKPGQFPTTRPAGFTLEQTLAKTGLNPLDEIMKNIPDKYDSSFTDKNQPEAMEGLAGFKQVKTVLNALSIIFWVLLGVIIVFLLLFAKLTSRTLLEFLMRLGIFLSAALVPFLTFAILWYVTTNIFLVEGLARLDFPSLVVKQIVEPLAAYTVGRVFIHLLAWSGAMSVVGLALAIPTGIILRRKPTPPRPEEPTPTETKPLEPKPDNTLRPSVASGEAAK
ncbi:MAG: hypothetical protein WC891_06935 [Actinomycetota bacterium]